MQIKFPLKEKIISAQSVNDILNKVLLAEEVQNIPTLIQGFSVLRIK